MTKALITMSVVVLLLATPASAHDFGRGSHMSFAPRSGFLAYRGFVSRPGFFPRRVFVHHRVFLGGFFAGPGVIVTACPYSYYVYPCYPYYLPYPTYRAPP